MSAVTVMETVSVAVLYGVSVPFPAASRSSVVPWSPVVSPVWSQARKSKLAVSAFSSSGTNRTLSSARSRSAVVVAIAGKSCQDET